MRTLRTIAGALLVLTGLWGGCRTEEAAPPATSQSTAPETTRSMLPDTAAASEGDYLRTSIGQTLYVPVYSHIYYRHGNRKINLTVTLSVRNTDPDRSMIVSVLDYHDTDGALVRSYLDEPRHLAPLATTEVIIDEHDETGGSGANFIVEWSASQPMTPPVVEAAMISTASAQGLSFSIPARVIRERSRP